MTRLTCIALLPLALLGGSTTRAFVPQTSHRQVVSRSNGYNNGAATTTSLGILVFDQLNNLFAPDGTKSSAVTEFDDEINECIKILNSAANTKSEDPEEVVTALEDLEQLARKKAKADPSFAQDVLTNLNGSWRLIFTTGTKTTQDRIQKTVNYFPIKAVQSFDTSTDPYGIENGIYLGDFAVVKFSGPFDFDLVRRKLEFDFTKIAVLGFEIQIKSEDAAKIGASTGLGSESNVKNSEKGKRPFFNWIGADATIATARGGGGGLALWKRIAEEEE